MDRRFTADLLAEFAAEAQERLDRLEELLLALPGATREERPGLLAAARLELHTLKGNAGMMGLSEQQVLAHELEDLTEEVDLTAPSVTPLLAGVDRFRMLVQESLETLGAGAPTASAAGPEGTAEVAATSVRIPFTVLDGLVDQLAEVVIIRNRLADALTGIGPRLLRTDRANHAERANRDERDQTGRRELTAAWEQVTLAHDRLGTVLDQLQGSVLHLRMVPLSSLFRQLSRIVHDTSAEEGKEVRFETAGADTPLDKALVELASDALGHLVRNAIIHGIEPPAERRRSGKPAAGTLRLEAVASPREVRIDVLDDGGGVDEPAVFAAARRHGHDVAPDQDPLELLFLPGLSTREEADLAAGRGIGLAAVRESVERHGGRVQVASRAGTGTLFRLHLPLSASITRALLFSADGEDYALPLRSVVESLRLAPGLLHEMNGAGVLTWRGGVLPALDLGLTFGTARERRRQGYAVVIEDGGRNRALLGDSVLGIREIVVKGLDSVLGAPPGIAGSTVLGDGRAILILDPAGLLALAPGRPVQEAAR
ncbi:MAG TPA: chemotaxis protein CheW [Thermoanaerobaculia bacterium]|nr:chemotaxis protein CheW [Thermoanaerobaculia bacterium]